MPSRERAISPWETSEDYLTSKQEQLWLIEGQAHEGLKQFLDDKSFRPGLGHYRRTPAGK